MPHSEAPTIIRSPHARLLLTVIAVAVLVRLIAAVVVLGPAFRFVDEAIYADAGVQLRSGGGLDRVAADMPGYSVFLALLDAVTPGFVIGLRVAQAVVLALGAALCYRLGSHLGGPAAGLAAAAIYALDPLVLLSSGLLYPDAPAALLLLGGVLAAWDAEHRGRSLSALGAGLLMGGLTLFRPVGLSLAPAMAAWLLTAPSTPWARRCLMAGLLGLGWLLTIAPWVERNLRVYGQPLPVGAVAVVRVPGIGDDAAERGLTGAIVGTVDRDPGGFARRTLREFTHFWEPYPTRLATDNTARRTRFAARDPRLSAAPLVQRSLRDLVSGVSYCLELLLAAIGLVAGWRSRRRETIWLVGVVLSFAVGYALFYGKVRYRIPILPIMFAFAGVGLVRILDTLGRLQRGRATAPPAARSHQ